MALNLKDALETVRRAGFGPDDRTNTAKSQQRMLNGEFLSNHAPVHEDSRTDPLDEDFSRIEYHRHPEAMSFKELADIDDL